MILKNYPKRRRQVAINYILPRNIDWSLLNEIETKIIEMRWGLGNYKIKHNLTEISEDVGLPVHVIHRLEKEAVKKIRNLK